jgi:hypothetical protein
MVTEGATSAEAVGMMCNALPIDFRLLRSQLCNNFDIFP